MENNIQKPLKVLCIEDEADIIDYIQFVVEREGFTFVSALGGQAGIETIRREKPDLVLLDIMMPEVDGWDVFRLMKADEALQNIPVIAVTAKAQNIDKVFGLHIAKVDDYVTKPFGPQELVQSIRRVLEKRKVS